MQALVMLKMKWGILETTMRYLNITRGIQKKNQSPEVGQIYWKGHF